MGVDEEAQSRALEIPDDALGGLVEVVIKPDGRRLGPGLGIGARRAFATPFLAMMISSPPAAASTKAERCVLAS
jgi:hypothetical protein